MLPAYVASHVSLQSLNDVMAIAILLVFSNGIALVYKVVVLTLVAGSASHGQQGLQLCKGSQAGCYPGDACRPTKARGLVYHNVHVWHNR